MRPGSAGGKDSLDLMRQVLDHTLVDADDWPCGMVDDIEMAGGPGEPLRVTALLVGPGAWAPRLPSLFAPITTRVFGSRCVRVPWTEVAVLGERIQLRSRAAHLGLGTVDRRLGARMERVPLSGKGDK